MSAREQIFSAIRGALAPLPHRESRPDVPRGVADAQWMGAEADTVKLFKDRASAVGTLCFSSVGELVSWISGQKPGKIFIPSELSAIASQLGTDVALTSEYQRPAVDEIDVAITPAAAGIAESGTIILTDDCTPDRLAALAPWTHIAVLRKDSIHRSIADAIAAMPDDPNIVWVTGPSKTADVEGILIKGVHGPGIQGCLLI
ncbi:MAG: hypothetical protein FGM15_06755 [Chthoniobacterales bacterium]|nr:hypothetical protein [Chthoniobacterales bacterium]